MEEDNEGNSEVKNITPTNINNSIIPLEPTIKGSKTFRTLQIILILIVTCGLILYINMYYIPDLKEESFDEGYSIGESNTLNNSKYLQAYWNNGYIQGQEEIIIKINQDAEIPVVSINANNVTSVDWYALTEICGYD